jgi:hypothetical protein
MFFKPLRIDFERFSAMEIWKWWGRPILLHLVVMRRSRDEGMSVIAPLRAGRTSWPLTR